MARLLLLLLLAAGAPSPALAQEPEAASQVDPTKLGVSLERIGRQLAIAESRDSRADHGLKLSYRVEVFGRGPAIDIIGDFDVQSGPVPGSGPSHREVVDFLTPQMFRTPPASLSNVVVWAAQQLDRRSRRRRCEDELSQYRAQVLSGINVSPPTCAP